MSLTELISVYPRLSYIFGSERRSPLSFVAISHYQRRKCTIFNKRHLKRVRCGLAKYMNTFINKFAGKYKFRLCSCIRNIGSNESGNDVHHPFNIRISLKLPKRSYHILRRLKLAYIQSDNTIITISSHCFVLGIRFAILITDQNALNFWYTFTITTTII